MARVKGAKIWLLGRVSDRPAATAFAAIHRGVAMLHALEVATDARRTGLGAAMTRTAALWAAENGAGSLALAVTEANAPACALYSGLGFRKVGGYHYRRAREPDGAGA